jgi:molybdopterin synthase sulfur carrier subunit
MGAIGRINMITARLTSGLEKLTGGNEEILLEAASIRECIEKLEQNYPGVKDKFCNENGELFDHIAVYINGDNICEMQGIETALKDGVEVDFMSGFAGGSW